jgi:hypothetical protein
VATVKQRVQPLPWTAFAKHTAPLHLSLLIKGMLAAKASEVFRLLIGCYSKGNKEKSHHGCGSCIKYFSNQKGPGYYLAADGKTIAAW